MDEVGNVRLSFDVWLYLTSCFFDLSGMVRTQHNMDEVTGSAGSPAFSPPNSLARQALRQVAGDKEMGG